MIANDTDADTLALSVRTERLVAEIIELAEESVRIRDQHRQQLDALKINIADMQSALDEWKARALDAEEKLNVPRAGNILDVCEP